MDVRSFRSAVRRNFGQRLQSFVYAAGLMRLGAHQRTGGAVILMYHTIASVPANRFVDPKNHVSPDVFEKQAHFLSRFRQVVALSELVALLREGQSPAPGTVAITFDDGYLDNLTVAAPILDGYGLKATLFLPTAYIDREEPQWVDQVYTAFTYRTQGTLTWSNSSTVTFNLDDSSDNTDAYATVCRSLLQASPERRRELLDSLQSQLAPSVQMPRLTMNWDDVRCLVRDFGCFEIGGHTHEHMDLTSGSLQLAQEELETSRERISDSVGTEPKLFSFPYGRTSPELRNCVRDAGFDAACGSGDRWRDPVVTFDHDLYALPRVEAPATMKRFDLLTDTANAGFWRRLAS